MRVFKLFFKFQVLVNNERESSDIVRKKVKHAKLLLIDIIHLDCLLGFKERYQRWPKYESVCS